ncbi:MAG: phosphatase PAP2 family protein [Actinomycetota bacterium]|nr:phosphatase PAP2 family protein [Actinomycetota bacterium]
MSDAVDFADRTTARIVAVVWAVSLAVSLGTGFLIVNVLEDGALGRFDDRVSRWFADQRTDTLNQIADTVAWLSDSFAVVPICAVLIAVFWWRWRRWQEIVLVVGALLLEKAVFVPTAMLVGRERPDVGQLDGSPPTASFPSGHVAAAVALYAALWLVFRAHHRAPGARALAAVVALVPPVAVLLARLELGMHHLSDVVWGAGVGLVAVIAVYRALLWPVDRTIVSGRLAPPRLLRRGSAPTTPAPTAA